MYILVFTGRCWLLDFCVTGMGRCGIFGICTEFDLSFRVRKAAHLLEDFRVTVVGLAASARGLIYVLVFPGRRPGHWTFCVVGLGLAAFSRGLMCVLVFAGHRAGRWIFACSAWDGMEFAVSAGVFAGRRVGRWIIYIANPTPITQKSSGLRGTPRTSKCISVLPSNTSNPIPATQMSSGQHGGLANPKNISNPLGISKAPCLSISTTQKSSDQQDTPRTPKNTSKPVQMLQNPHLPRKSPVASATETKYQIPYKCFKSHAYHVNINGKRRISNNVTSSNVLSSCLMRVCICVCLVVCVCMVSKCVTSKDKRSR